MTGNMASTPTTLQTSPTSRIGATVHFRPMRSARRRRSGPLTINMTPMIDVVFNLLIYFVLTTSFRAPEGLFESRLPRTHGLLAGTEVPISPIYVQLFKGGPDPEDFTIRIKNFATTPRNFQELTAILREIQTIQGYDAETPVIITPADRIRWDYVLQAYSAAMRASYNTINFGVQ